MRFGEISNPEVYNTEGVDHAATRDLNTSYLLDGNMYSLGACLPVHRWFESRTRGCARR